MTTNFFDRNVFKFIPDETISREHTKMEGKRDEENLRNGIEKVKLINYSAEK